MATMPAIKNVESTILRTPSFSRDVELHPIDTFVGQTAEVKLDLVSRQNFLERLDRRILAV